MALACSEAGAGGALEQDELLAQTARSIRVKAEGSGCPRGTWDARIREGGARIELEFLRFYARAEETGGEVLRDCEVRVSVSGEEDVSYAPVTFEVSGRADSISLATELWWMSNPEQRRSTTSSIDGDFYENQEVEGLWSPCGASAELAVSLRASASKGYMRLHDSVITLAKRRCDANSGSGPTPETDGGSAGPAEGDRNGGPEVQSPDAGSEPEQPSSGSVGDGGTPGKPAIEIGTPAARGAGCAGATTTASIRPDGTSLSMTFSGFSVQLGAGASADGSCNITIPVGTAVEEAYAIASVIVRGSSSLQQEMQGIVSALPRIQGVGSVGEARETITGPVDGAFSFSKDFVGESLAFVPCGRSRNLQLALSAGILDAASAAGRTGAIDLSEVIITFARRACPN